MSFAGSWASAPPPFTRDASAILGRLKRMKELEEENPSSRWSTIFLGCSRKKALGPDEKKAMVGFMVVEHGISHRQAC